MLYLYAIYIIQELQCTHTDIKHKNCCLVDTEYFLAPGETKHTTATTTTTTTNDNDNNNNNNNRNSSTSGNDTTTTTTTNNDKDYDNDNDNDDDELALCCAWRDRTLGYHWGSTHFSGDNDPNNK